MPRAFTDRERDAIRAALLDAARAALPRTGMRRTPVEELARAAGISKGAFYLFFETKEGLWIALLREAEERARGELRRILADDDPLPGVLGFLFRDLWADPVLRALADPEDLAWLARGLPPGTMEAARADDDRFFTEVHAELRRRGALRDDVSAEVFCALPRAALALAQQGSGPVVAWIVDGLALRLGR